MSRKTKYLLATSCLIALGVIVYRYARLENNYLISSKTKIYSFNLGNNAVTIKQGGLNKVENVEWANGTPQDVGKNTDTIGNDNGINKLPANKDVSAIVATPKYRLNERPNIKTESSYKIIKKANPPTIRTTVKLKPAVTLPLLTKSVTNKRAVVMTTSKAIIPAVTVKSGDLPMCSHTGENLVGPLAVDQNVPASEDNIEDGWDKKGWVEKGGAWRPMKCQAVSKVAIIIPYRKREQHLKILLHHMHPMLKRQLLDYRILIIEQAGDTPFNRAMLFNIGYKESLKFHDFKCFIFHDVDLLPENDKNYYGCPTAPRHLSVAIDKFNYRLPYQGIFGGAGAFRKEDFEKINGFSNRFWGWGGEDDDLYKRIIAKGFKLTRPSMVTGRYKMVKLFHTRAKADPLRFDKLRSSKQRMSSDGLNSLKYKVQQTDERPLYTKVTVEVNPNEV